MKWMEAAYLTKSDELDEVCLILTEAGAEGLVIEDEADFREFLENNRRYWDYVDEALERRYAGVSRVKLYVSPDDEGRARLASFTAALGREPLTRIVDDADWRDKWKEYYRPLEVGEKLLILPKWEPIPQDIPRKVLRLDPGLSFGTGNHASTRMCLEELEKYAAPEKFVLDLGCGSGILGIGALVLGCAFAAGCDVDEASPRVAMENARLNGIGEMIYQMSAGDVLTDAALRERLGFGYDVVLANIVADVIIPLAALAPEMKTEKGVFICSGVIEGRQDEVRAAIEKAGMVVVSHRSADGWHCFTAI